MLRDWCFARATGVLESRDVQGACFRGRCGIVIAPGERLIDTPRSARDGCNASVVMLAR